MKYLRAVPIAFVLTSLAYSQTFGVASVKSSDGGGSYRVKVGPGSVSIMHSGLAGIITWAYSLQDIQLYGPDWLTYRPFDIEAKTAGPTSEAAMRVMMQHLLTERFRLVVHWTEKPRNLYVMRVPINARGNFKPSTLQELGKDPSRSEGVQFSWIAEQCSLGGEFGVSVFDATDMPGRWDFAFKWPDSVEPVGADLQTVMPFRANYARDLRQKLTQQLGVQFTHETYPVKTLVIDQADRIPSPN